MIFDSIINRNEFFSDHYLDALIQSDLSGLRSEWDEAEGAGKETARSRVRTLSKPFFAAKTAVLEAADQATVLVDLHSAVLRALGFEPERNEVTLTRGAEEDVVVPVAHAADISTGLLLVALELGFATDIDAVFDPEGPGQLGTPLFIEGGKAEVTSAAEAVSYLFATDDPPRFVLLVAGTILVLCDRRNWSEGKFLAVDLDLALSRGDVTAKGELETVAALFSSDALVPSEGQSVLDDLTTKSHKHAIGVSEDLRDGIRYSIEILANEVVAQRKAKKKSPLGGGSASDLASQCLRFLYRLLFLLYAEARPDLKILPTEYPEYGEGYGLDRLRDLALVDLTSESNHGSHLHDSMDLLFRLVNDGYHHRTAVQQLVYSDELSPDASHDIRLVFEPLESELFSHRATPLIDEVRLRNEALQKVLKLLLLSREQKGKQRGFVSYAQLGINQLGAVYERLMAYTGFFAEEELYEVRRPGAKESDGTWVVPVSKADEYEEDAFVTRIDPDGGAPKRVRHEKGSFVFRLSGRDRQRSASYYTPEVLTECVVRHALAELLDPAGETTPASRLLEFTICEPALGSGAFLNEAINQLANEYLSRRQAELGEVIDPEKYPVELQKVKAHIALHQSYGVDLNATAVELAEVSLWLNAMYPGLRAPWFGLRLRRGNSLVGARRAVYSRDQLLKGAWLKSAPVARKLSEASVEDGEIHHFLLPSAGWGAVATSPLAKQLRPDEVKDLQDWRKAITRAPSMKDTDRLVALARRVESLWADASNALRLFEKELYRPIALYGQVEPERGRFGSREAIEQELRRPNSALGRLRLAMDAWAGLWFWPTGNPDKTLSPPSLAEWIDALEALLGIEPEEDPPGQMQLFDSLDELHQHEEQLSLDLQRLPVEGVLDRYPWFRSVRDISDREGFFHWELEFAPVFQRGGFDVQVGNPPWVRPEWDDDLILSEYDPWFSLSNQPKERSERRKGLLSLPQIELSYLESLASETGQAAVLADPFLFPSLRRLHTNLYRSFMVVAWGHGNERGVVGLLHPDSHLYDVRAVSLRQESYSRLRRLWQFSNQLKYFEDIGNTRGYAVNVYGAPRPASFLFAANLLTPETIDQSLEHDGTGLVPGIKTAGGEWDVSPHAHRILEITLDVLDGWRSLFDEPDTPSGGGRLLRPHSRYDVEVLALLANEGSRLGDCEYLLDPGLAEASQVKAGVLVKNPATPSTMETVVLQNPHFNVSNLFFQQTKEVHRSHRDYESLDLNAIHDDTVIRTTYQVSTDLNEYLAAAVPVWKARYTTQYWRAIYKRWVDPVGERTLQAALLFPGPYHVESAYSVVMESASLLVRLVGLWSSLPFDYLVRSIGTDNLRSDVVSRLPFPSDSPFYSALCHRTLRLNALTARYRAAWESCFSPSWTRDSFTREDPRLAALSDADSRWNPKTPLRIAFSRRQALIEIDVLASLILGMSVEQLITIYRTRFPVLGKYERNTYFDARGHQVSSALVRAWKRDSSSVDLSEYILPFDQPDRESEMRFAYEEFSQRHSDGVL